MSFCKIAAALTTALQKYNFIGGGVSYRDSVGAGSQGKVAVGR